MFSFHLGPGIDILFEKSTAQIDAPLGLGTLLCVEAPSDLRVDIVKMQELLVRVSEAVLLTMARSVAFEKQSVHYASMVENFIQSLSSFLISLPLFLGLDYGALLGLPSFKSEERT